MIIISKTIEKYIENKYYDEIFNRCKGFILGHKSQLQFKSYLVLDASYVELDDIHVRSVIFKGEPGNHNIQFNACIEADVILKGLGRKSYEADTDSVWLKVSFFGILSEGLRDVKIIGVDEYSRERFNKETRLDRYLVPYLYAEDLDKAAEDFLKRNYPDALEKAMPIDVMELAENMCLTVYKAPLPSNIFGQSYFDKATVEVYEKYPFHKTTQEIDYGTILVNPNVFFMRTIGSLNTTVVHECVHHDRHALFFELQKILNGEFDHLSCEVVESYGAKGKGVDDALSWMEWQANALAPRIQMPTKTAKKKFSQILGRLHNEWHDERDAVIMEMAVEEIAEFYQVSKTLAKIRVMDMGFPAEGTCLFVDGYGLPPYIYKADALKKDESFILDEKNEIFLSYFDPKISELVKSGSIVYANCTFCINDEKYITYSEVGVPILTDYALEHMDECCLKFKRKNRVSQLYDDSYYKQCFLCRDVDSESFVEADFNSEDEDNQDVAKRAEEMRKISKAAKSLADIFEEMPGSFSKTLIYHMKRKDITVEELEGASGVSARSIGTYRNDPEAKPDFYTVLALCIGMKLQPTLALDLLDKAGHNLFKQFSEEKACIYDLINNHHMESLDDWNRKLAQWGLKARIPSVKAAEKRGTEDDFEIE